MHTLLVVNGWLTLATGLGWLVYEGFALADDVEGNTISELVWSFVRAKPFMATVVCLVLGILLGHLFWQANRDAVRVALTRFWMGGRP
jgi:hypothetical protein